MIEILLLSPVMIMAQAAKTFPHFAFSRPKAVSIDKLGLAQFHLVRYDTYEEISLGYRRTRVGYR